MFHVKHAEVADVDRVAPLLDADRLHRKDSVIFLATDHTGAALGFTQLYPALCSLSLKYYAVLFDLFVAPDVRRLGVGKQLLHHAHAYARKAGLDRLELQTAHANTAAQALYASLGWTRDDIFSVYVWRPR
jgi:GNAT superfamily N-acetyltransferase